MWKKTVGRTIKLPSGVEPRPLTAEIARQLDRKSIKDDRIAATTDELLASDHERSLTSLQARILRKSARRYRTLANILGLISAVSLLVFLFGLFRYGLNDSLTEVALVIVFICGLPVPSLIRQEKRILAPFDIVTYDEVIRGPFLLFLRSFEMDDRTLSWRDLGGDSIEMVIHSRMQLAGFVVAVGNPAEKSPPVGANRLYLSVEDWQARVSELLKRAQCVVLAVGGTEGVRWELTAAFKAVDPRRLILFLPFQFARQKERLAAWSVIQEVAANAGVTLPSELQDSLFITFGTSWEPNLIQATVPPHDQAYGDLRLVRTRRGISAALNSVFPDKTFETEDDRNVEKKHTGLVARQYGKIRVSLKKH